MTEKLYESTGQIKTVRPVYPPSPLFPLPSYKFRRLPSGVVEVLEIPEKTGLFLGVVDRIFVQDGGHACCCERTSERRFDGSSKNSGGPRRPENTRAGSSALDDVRKHFKSSAASASLSPAAAVIYAAVDL